MARDAPFELHGCPREERQRSGSFNEIRIRSDDGVERPITELAEVDVARGYSVINRADQMRSIAISASVDDASANTSQIVQAMRSKIILSLATEFPNVTVKWEGQQRQADESISTLLMGFVVALLAMFVLLSLEFKSYFQPFIIFLIIPFGFVGVVWGHAFVGIPLTLFSLFGVVTLSGIVINDSIVLVDFISRQVSSGQPLSTACREAGSRRFRPVFLTTITTICGLLPLLLETSRQAQLLIPMATSIVFRKIVSTIVVLYLVPVSYSLYGSASGIRKPAPHRSEFMDYVAT